MTQSTVENPMFEFYLIRHAQASFGAENYDKLSPLGHRQAHWLGEYFQQRDIAFDAVVTGAQVRHRETAESLCGNYPSAPEISIHQGLNEFDFEAVTSAYLHTCPQQKPAASAGPRAYCQLLKNAMQAWLNGELDGGVPESWQAFEDRVAAALEFICQLGDSDAPATAGAAKRRLLVVSSGGAIAVALKHILGFPGDTVIQLNMQMKNTGVSHCYSNNNAIRLSSFNNVPHLETADRLEAVTYS